MTSIGHAAAHWKQVSHLRLPRSSYSRINRPRWRGLMSCTSSGYCTVTLGPKNRPSVVSIPLAMPQPGSLEKLISVDLRRRLLGSSPRQGVEDQDRAGRDENVQQRDFDEPLPGPTHDLVDSDTWQGAAHPHEDERKGERLGREPEQA